ncbi:MAG: HAMP domain-containing sensor histidine kinase [Pigmentiphaga sp.]|uniref:sensor histidine kinase n=1 Tax=Pigmentiphaga sp. TaxID=1977564 RepID=UPI0029A357C1|nr:HAMP domain-containing sensor histidine kinase [Pigmentiphaga sp.]MDX3904192.1 HAMP domain-containing sensor histidine kinase [Pigmentiphaga sp.]
MSALDDDYPGRQTGPLAFVRRLWQSVAFRLALGYGASVMLFMMVLLSVLYVQTIGVLQNRIDRQLMSAIHRMTSHFETYGWQRVAADITETLADGVNSDTEAYLLATPSGEKIAGNIDASPELLKPTFGIVEKAVIRDGRTSYSRFRTELLADGSILVVGRDMRDQKDLEQLVGNALMAAALVALLLALVGAVVFRDQLERRVGAIRRTAAQIEAGDLTQRIPVSGKDDEFARLSHDINLMLDRIEILMDGVRHVSNTIAHNLRTPLSRIRAKLEVANRPGADAAQLAQANTFAIREIEELTVVFDKLLQIAEAESGARRQAFQPVSLNDIVTDVVELYEPVAEEKGVELRVHKDEDVVAAGDRDLLASAVANLVDNAIKYAGSPARVTVSTRHDADTVSIVVQDNGPGIQAIERSKVGTRFFRLNRRVPGYGLGLASVTAIASLHHATLHLDDAAPGLVARIALPRDRNMTKR